MVLEEIELLYWIILKNRISAWSCLKSWIKIFYTTVEDIKMNQNWQEFVFYYFPQPPPPLCTPLINILLQVVLFTREPPFIVVKYKIHWLPSSFTFLSLMPGGCRSSWELTPMAVWALQDGGVFRSSLILSYEYVFASF